MHFFEQLVRFPIPNADFVSDGDGYHLVVVIGTPCDGLSIHAVKEPSPQPPSFHIPHLAITVSEKASIIVEANGSMCH